MTLLGKYFSKKDLEAITKACSKVEEHTSGEIRVSVYSKCPSEMKDKNIMDIALAEFYRLGMEKTRDRTGILLFILLGRRQFQILADEGINAKVDQSVWDEIALSLSQSFKKSEYWKGVVQVVEKMGDILSEHFSRKPDDTNELTDEVSVR